MFPRPIAPQLFKVANIYGRESKKVRRAFEKSNEVCFAKDKLRLVAAGRALTGGEYDDHLMQACRISLNRSNCSASYLTLSEALQDSARDETLWDGAH
jgi:hypothetical protein